MAQLPEFVCACIGFFDWFQFMMQFSAMSCQWTHSEKSVRQLCCIGADLDGQSRLLGVWNCWSHKWISVSGSYLDTARNADRVCVWPSEIYKACPDRNCWTLCFAVTQCIAKHLWKKHTTSSSSPLTSENEVWTWKTKRIRWTYIVVQVLQIQQEHMRFLVWSLPVSVTWQEGLPF